MLIKVDVDKNVLNYGPRREDNVRRSIDMWIMETIYTLRCNRPFGQVIKPNSYLHMGLWKEYGKEDNHEKRKAPKTFYSFILPACLYL